MADFQKGDFLISRDARNVDKDYLMNNSFHIYTGGTVYVNSGLGSRLEQLECHDIILGRAVHFKQGTYSHFWRKMKPEEKAAAIEVLKDMDYDFNEETLELIKLPITDTQSLKKRLLEFLRDPNSGTKLEREALTEAINNLL